MTDDQILDAIKSVCGFDGAEVERWRVESLLIGRAVANAAFREAADVAEMYDNGTIEGHEISGLILERGKT